MDQSNEIKPTKIRDNLSDLSKKVVMSMERRRCRENVLLCLCCPCLSCCEMADWCLRVIFRANNDDCQSED